MTYKEIVIFLHRVLSFALPWVLLVCYAVACSVKPEIPKKKVNMINLCHIQQDSCECEHWYFFAKNQNKKINSSVIQQKDTFYGTKIAKENKNVYLYDTMTFITYE